MGVVLYFVSCKRVRVSSHLLERALQAINIFIKWLRVAAMPIRRSQLSQLHYCLCITAVHCMGSTLTLECLDVSLTGVVCDYKIWKFLWNHTKIIKIFKWSLWIRFKLTLKLSWPICSIIQISWEITETLAYGHSSESTPCGLSIMTAFRWFLKIFAFLCNGPK